MHSKPIRFHDDETLHAHNSADNVRQSCARAENRINGFVVPRSSVNGRENIAKSIDVLKIGDRGRGVDDNELGHKADLQESLLRRDTRQAEVESFVIEPDRYMRLQFQVLELEIDAKVKDCHY